MNFNSIEEVLKANLSNDEKTRAAAEAFIHSQVDTNFGQFLDELLKGITLQDPMVICAIIKTDSKLDGWIIGNPAQEEIPWHAVEQIENHNPTVGKDV